MDGLQQLLLTAATVVGAIVLIGGALALVRGSYNKARIQALREDVGDYDRRLKSCEEQLRESKIREDTLQVEMNHVTSENKLLKAMVLQRADVQTVLGVLNTHHEQAMEVWARLTTFLEAQGVPE